MSKPTFTKAVQAEIYNAYNWCCAGCGQSDFAYLQCDHVHPRAAGGEHTLANGQILCSACNNLKNDRIGVPKLLPRTPLDSVKAIAAARFDFAQWIDSYPKLK